MRKRNDQGSRDAGLERAGRALRQLRKRRHLSLEAAAKLTSGYREPVNKSYLHRLEGGRVSPSVSRLAVLAAAYGVPTTVLVELFELEERLGGVVPSPGGRTPEELLAVAESRLEAGRHVEALALARAGEPEARGETAVKLKQCEISCLLKMHAYESAKSEALRLLERPLLDPVGRVHTLYLAATALSHLKYFTAAFALLEGAVRVGDTHPVPLRTKAYIALLRGTLEHRTGDFEGAARSFTDAMRRFEDVPDPHEACRARIDLAGSLIELGLLEPATSHLETALRTAEKVGFRRLSALVLGGMAVVHFRRANAREARRAALRSNQIATEIDDPEILFRNSFYLSELARREGDETSHAAHERTLRRLLPQVDPDAHEAVAFRTRLGSREGGRMGGGGG